MNAIVVAIPVDLLRQAIETTRGYLDGSASVKERARIFWAAVAAARDLGASDVIHDEFYRLAVYSGLWVQLERSAPYDANATLDHLIRWGLLKRNPFEKAK